MSLSLCGKDEREKWLDFMWGIIDLYSVLSKRIQPQMGNYE